MPLKCFLNVSIDGYYATSRGDMDWAQSDDPEWNSFVEANASGDGTLVLGRTTYQMLASFWPTADAQRLMPALAERMNALPKVVFTRSGFKPAWSNTEVVDGDAVTKMRAIKDTHPGPMTVLGSGRLLAAFAAARLVDEFHLVVNPVALGDGKRLFDGIDSAIPLTLHQARTFRNGKVLMILRPRSE